MAPDTPSIIPDARLAALRARLDARAAGWWRVEGERLILVAFDAADDMPDEVTRGFVGATREVSMTQTGLGIVRAAVTGETAVSRAGELPEGSGSGLWLRRFGAGRSVAVPVRDEGGAVAAVVSVALADDQRSDEKVIRALRDEAEVWLREPGPETGRTPTGA